MCRYSLGKCKKFDYEWLFFASIFFILHYPAQALTWQLPCEKNKGVFAKLKKNKEIKED